MVRAAPLMIVSAFGVGSQFAPAAAQDAKEPPKNGVPAAVLKGGDPAPPLKVSRWLQGEEVKAFEPGKVYVVEFWATWCGPCIAFMPHLARLQAEYKDKGVTVIGFTSRDLLGNPDHTEEMVAAFVKKRGPGLKYTFAYADDPASADAWLKAAGRTGIPCTFVVDKAGRIAYIGHPMYLPLVLPKVVEGADGAKAVSDEMAKVEAEFAASSAERARDPEAGLRAVKAFEAKYPPLADFVPSVRVKLSYLPRHGEVGEAKEYAERLMARAVERGDRLTLSMVASILRLGDGKESKELLAVAVRAAEAESRLAGGADALALISLANTYAVAGDAAKAKESARKAVEAAEAAGEPASLREYVGREARRLGGEEAGGKK
ncbi:MAG TPA: TlpA disulfide reductase family protein [Gemmataceae bacterium]|nr:TlpA disulfide reductase family protein [Gemmataceae bacterium]